MSGAAVTECALWFRFPQYGGRDKYRFPSNWLDDRMVAGSNHTGAASKLGQVRLIGSHC